MRIVFIQMFLEFRAKTGRDKITRKWRREENEQRGHTKGKPSLFLIYVIFFISIYFCYEDNVQVKLKLKLAPIFLPLRAYTKAFY